MSPGAWYADDAFWEGWHPVMFGEGQFRSAPTEVDRVVEVLGLHPGMRVLDIPSGPGRHSLELARRGLRVTAVDLTAGLLERLRADAMAEDLAVEAVTSDMRAFRRDEAFDAVVNLWSSFGYFDDPADDERVLANLHGSLRPGGGLFLETLSKETLARGFRPARARVLDDGTVVAERVTVRDGWGWMDQRWVLSRPDGERLEKRFGRRLYSATELVSLLREAGFEDVRTFDGYRDAPFDHDATGLGIAAWKPGGDGDGEDRAPAAEREREAAARRPDVVGSTNVPRAV